MSGLVDMWTSEWAKLREKGKYTVPPSGGVESAGRAEVVKEVNDEHQMNSRGLTALLKFKSDRDQAAYYSEATIQMIMECFSP